MQAFHIIISHLNNKSEVPAIQKESFFNLKRVDSPLAKVSDGK
jgi:hypothetical protein